MGQRVVYATREACKTATDSKLTARDDARVDRAVLAASDTIDGDLHRSFAPTIRTVRFDWTNHQQAPPWRLWLDSNTLISIVSIVAGGVTLSPADYILRRSDDLAEPPYDQVQLLTSSSATFSGSSTHQQAIAITGLYGYTDVQVPVGALAEALDNSETGVDVTDVSGIGVGSLVSCESERMLVTAKSLLDSGQNLGTNLTKAVNDETVNLALGSAFHVGEEIVIDAERMLLVDIAGNNGLVKRAWNGSTLAAHTTPADIFVPRTLTVERGAAGTTATTHLTATALTVWQPPALIQSLCVAESITTLQQELAAYGRTVGSGENERESAGRGLTHIRNDAMTTFGRQARLGVV